MHVCRPHGDYKEIGFGILEFGFSVSPCVHPASLPLLALQFGYYQAQRGVSFAILSRISSDLSYVARVSRLDLSVG